MTTQSPAVSLFVITLHRPSARKLFELRPFTEWFSMRTLLLKYAGNIWPQPRSALAGMTGLSAIVESPIRNSVSGELLGSVAARSGFAIANKTQRTHSTWCFMFVNGLRVVIDLTSLRLDEACAQP